MMIALGPFRFSIDTAPIVSESHRRGWQWVENEVIGSAPELQFTGSLPELMELRGVIYPHYRGGFLQVDLMAAMAETGEPQLLVTGTGKVLGLWVIEGIEDDRSRHFVNGLPRKIEFGIHLKKYGPLTVGGYSLDNYGASNIPRLFSGGL